MNNIHLFKPIVLRKSLSDMSEGQRLAAENLLRGTKLLAFTRSGPTMLDHKKEDAYPAHFFYGSEAVCLYRQSLGLPDISIRTIDVNSILQKVPCFDACYDILFFLRRIHNRNSRARRLQELNAPPIILINEYRLLQEYTEFLEDNNWCGHPIKDCYDVDQEDGTSEHFEDIRKSLKNLGLSLLPTDADKEAAPKKDGSFEKRLLDAIFEGSDWNGKNRNSQHRH